MDAYKSDMLDIHCIFQYKSDDILNAINILKFNVLCEIIAT